jgi:hypothetical protein
MRCLDGMVAGSPTRDIDRNQTDRPAGLRDVAERHRRARRVLRLAGHGGAYISAELIEVKAGPAPRWLD